MKILEYEPSAIYDQYSPTWISVCLINCQNYLSSRATAEIVFEQESSIFFVDVENAVNKIPSKATVWVI